ncbi:MAG TPA: FAD-dependent oxidoreductase [Thermoanaerobaculia bacterium]|nr:FAD-dependent oxidoreductase [Thermoanaerobaculia bacterium]
MSTLGSSPERPLSVAVVGAGPSGFYAVAALLDCGREVAVDVFDRLPAPYGLVRYGVAPDHQKIKLVERVFAKAAGDPRVRFFGNVGLGSDVTRDELLDLYDQVVYAVGAQSDRRLGIPGEELPGSWSSTEFVAWYNGHPDFVGADYRLDHAEVAVVGIGNVAMDCARVLAKPAEELAATDVSDPALDAFRQSRVTDVHVLARRGPAQAKCTPAELKELGEIEGVEVMVDGDELEAAAVGDGELDRQAQKNLEIFRGFAERTAGGAWREARRRIRFRFLVSPVEIEAAEGGGGIGGLVIERNRLVAGADGRLRPRGTGETETLATTAVIRAIGYRSVPLPGVPFDEEAGLIPNREGRVIDPEAGAPLGREYVVGWAKRGPSGLIGTNKPDAAETVARMVKDVPALPADPPRPAAAIERLLAGRGVDWVDFEDWRRLDELECARGKAAGRPRIKLCAVEEMLAEVARAREDLAASG